MGEGWRLCAEVEYNIVFKFHFRVCTRVREARRVICKPVPVAQQLYAPFLERDIKVDPPASIPKLGKCNQRSIGVHMAATVKFVLELRLRRSLPTRSTNCSYGRQLHTGKTLHHMDCKEEEVFLRDGRV